MQLIDLQLLVTHIIGFVIVLWLLRRFAWTPILEFLQARSDKIAGEISAAEQQNEQATQLREQYQTQIDNIEAEARQSITEVRAEQRQIRARAEADLDASRRQRKQQLEDDLQRITGSARDTLRKQTVELALVAAEKAIRERMDGERQRQLIEQFIDEIGTGSNSAGAD